MKKFVIKTIPGRPDHRIPRTRWMRGKHVFIALVVLGVAFGSYSLLQTPDEKVPATPPAPATPAEPVTPVSLDYPDAFAVRSQYLERFAIRHHIVRAGESLSGIVEASGLPAAVIGQWEKSCRNFPALSQIKPDDEFIIHVGRSDNQPVKLILSAAQGSTYTLRRVGTEWDCRDDGSRPLPIGNTVRGVYAEDLYESCIGAGLPAALVADLTDIFAYDVDFNSDLKEGDTFVVHYEDWVKDGRKSRPGVILAAELTVSGQRLQAFLYQFPDGSTEYFDAKGTSLRKPFLKSPLNYRRIMAASNYKPLKPILKIYRPHLGVDYTAPKGTPVSAVGDGTVAAMGRTDKAGRFIQILHKGGYKTHYGHLSGFSKGLAKGKKVTLGESIGLVGSTDASTTPYLDFRFVRNGKPVNYLKSDFPRSRTIPKTLRLDFEKKRDLGQAALDGSSAPTGKTAEGSTSG